MPAVMDCVDLEKTRLFISVNVINADRDFLFQKVSWLGAAFILERELFLVRFQLPVDGGGAGFKEQCLDLRGNAERLFQMFDLPPDGWARIFLPEPLKFFPNLANL